MKLLKKYSVIVIFSLLIFGIFLWVSSKSPLAGDDWAFLNHLQTQSVWDAAWSMYLGWEARLATLLSIHFIIQSRMLWMIINASIYALVYILTMIIVKPKHKILSSLFFIFLLISVKDNVRMEVYSWTTGSVYYGIPLLLSMAHFFILYQSYYYPERKPSYVQLLLSFLVSFYLPLGMENIAISVVIMTIGVTVLTIIQKRDRSNLIYSQLAGLVVGYTIWFLSPGSAVRMAQIPEWSSLGFVGKIIHTIPDVMFYTFHQNKYLVFSLSLILIISNLTLVKQKFIKTIGLLVYGFSILVVFSLVLVRYFPSWSWLEPLSSGTHWMDTTFWILYATFAIINILMLGLNKRSLVIVIPILVIAVLSSASLLLSPVIGYRLMIYPIVYLSILSIVLLDNIPLKSIKVFVLNMALIFLCLVELRTWMIKYNQVQVITLERESILNDYKLYHDLYKDGIWLPRYPAFTIHGGDIEIEDTYHMNAFKEYYGIPTDELITFYWKEKY